MSLIESDELIITLESAIQAAQLRLESELETVFKVLTTSDLFYLDSKYHGGLIPNDLLRLRLKNGFLSGIVSVFYGELWSTANIPLPSIHYTLDTGKGLIYLDKSYKNYFVKVTYTSGFNTNTEVPEWLREAIISYVPMILNTNQTTNRNAEADNTAKLSETHALAVIRPYLRDTSLFYRPLT